jgi:hypothetical protein
MVSGGGWLDQITVSGDWDARDNADGKIDVHIAFQALEGTEIQTTNCA